MMRFRKLAPWLHDAFRLIERTAGAGRLGHGWLVLGPRGSGKRNLVYVLADRLLHGELGSRAPEAAAPDDVLGDYAALAAYEPPEAPDLHPDLHRVRPEEGKRTISVEQIRSMKDDVVLTPHMAPVKVVVIESAESMTTEAANALLKTLEEPTANTYLFLLAERTGPLPPTVRSRCQRLRITTPGATEARAWCESGRHDAGTLPSMPATAAPIILAHRISDHEKLQEYNKLLEQVESFYEGRSGAHEVAANWVKGDTDTALSCLVASLQASIRHRLVPGLRTKITDEVLPIAHNSKSGPSIESLFEGLRLAENLREQLGRGINMELAIGAMLLDLKEARDRQ